jgi:hypothetical protein
MTVRVGSRRIKTPSGVEWRVGRRWASRGLPRWRRIGIEHAAEPAIDGAWYFPVDVGPLEDFGLVLAGIVALIVVIVIVIPLLLFGIELIILGLLVAAGIVARSALGRPWIVEAVPGNGESDALAWEVKGWRRSNRLIDEVSAAIVAGSTPPPSP